MVTLAQRKKEDLRATKAFRGAIPPIFFVGVELFLCGRASPRELFLNVINM